MPDANKRRTATRQRTRRRQKSAPPTTPPTARPPVTSNGAMRTISDSDTLEASSSSWGANLIGRAPRPLQRVSCEVANTIRRPSLLLSLMLVTLVTLTAIIAYYHIERYQSRLGAYGFPSTLVGLADLSDWGAKAIGQPQLGVNPIGYDGQFYYYLAYRPAIIVECSQPHFDCPMYTPDLRMQRILYPMTAWALSLGGQPGLLPFALPLINLIAILVMCWLIGQLCLDAGFSRWPAIIAALFCGNVLGAMRDLGDPFAVMWVIVAVFLMYRKHYLWAAVAVAAALLSREALVFFLPFLALPLLAQRRWATLLLHALIGYAPFVAWQLTLHLLYGGWPLITQDNGAAKPVLIPFSGLLSLRHENTRFPLLLFGAGIPLAFAMVLCVKRVWDAGPRGLLHDPLPLMAFIYGLLYSLTYYFNWADLWAAGRLSAPGVMLGALVALRITSPSARTAYFTVLILAAGATFVFLWGG
ncbi:MAG: hypothetical protein ABI068_00710 [Ktedonobacterales bacterium]